MPKRSRKPILIPCSQCRGTGTVEINGIYADTLALLRAQKGELSGADLARLDGCKHTAMNNRLVRLEELGLVVSRAYGRKRLWTAKV